MTTYRTLPQEEVIPPNAEFLCEGEWIKTGGAGLISTPGVQYRVPIHQPPTHPDESPVVSSDKTPRTWAAKGVFAAHHSAEDLVLASMAAQLERELNQARMVAENLRYGIGATTNEFMQNKLPWE